MEGKNIQFHDGKEIRTANVMFQKSGGTGKGGITNRMTLPTRWIKEMGISEEEREVDIIFDREDNQIIIRKKNPEDSNKKDTKAKRAHEARVAEFLRRINQLAEEMKKE